MPRLLILTRKIVAGIRRNVVRLADGRTSLRAVREDEYWSPYGWLNEAAFGNLVFKRYDMVGGEFEGRRAGGVQTYLVHELLARIIVAYIDAFAAVVTGVELSRVDLDDGEVQGVLTGFGGGDNGRSPDELTKDTLLLRVQLSGNLVAQDPEFLQPILRLL